jgi:ribosomal protein S18 acetylase RimI-like enzyme
MQSILVKLLKSAISAEELSCDNYYSTSRVFVITDERDIYEVENNTKINFKPVGIAIITNDTNCLCMFAINPNFKRQKYGDQLLQTVIQIYDKINLYVRISNKPAISLYEKYGFIIKEKHEDFYKYTLNNEDAYYMIYNKDLSLSS